MPVRAGARYKRDADRDARLDEVIAANVERIGNVVVAALREVVEPRERPLMPSPFGTVVEPSPTPAA